MTDQKNKDLYELLDELRLLLNDSKIEQMQYFATNSKFKKDCSYYIKSKMLFDTFEKKKIEEVVRLIQEKLDV